jgi:hypothetical protein
LISGAQKSGEEHADIATAIAGSADVLNSIAQLPGMMAALSST